MKRGSAHTFIEIDDHWFVSKLRTETLELLSSLRIPPKKPTSFAEIRQLEWCETQPMLLPVVVTGSQPTALLWPLRSYQIQVRLTRHIVEIVPSLRSLPPWIYMYSLPLLHQMKATWFERRSGSLPCTLTSYQTSSFEFSFISSLCADSACFYQFQLIKKFASLQLLDEPQRPSLL